MTTLYDRYVRPQSGVRPEDTLDIILSLVDLVANRRVSVLSPDALQVAEDNTLSPVENPRPDPFWQAPEELIRNDRPDQMSQWFSLGLLIFFLLNGASWYESCRLVDLPEKMACPPALMPPPTSPESSGVPFLLESAMHNLTSWIRESRVSGVSYLLEATRSCPGEARVVFTAGARPVCERVFPVSGTLPEWGKGHLVEADNQTWYAPQGITIPFRPGSRSYALPVRPATGQEGTPPQPGKDRFLCLSLGDTPKPIVKLTDRSVSLPLKIPAGTRVMALLLALGDPRTGRVEGRKYVQQLSFPDLTRNLTLHLDLHPNRTCTLHLPPQIAAQGGPDGTIRFAL